MGAVIDFRNPKINIARDVLYTLTQLDHDQQAVYHLQNDRLLWMKRVQWTNDASKTSHAITLRNYNDMHKRVRWLLTQPSRRGVEIQAFPRLFKLVIMDSTFWSCWRSRKLYRGNLPIYNEADHI